MSCVWPLVRSTRIQLEAATYTLSRANSAGQENQAQTGGKRAKHEMNSQLGTLLMLAPVEVGKAESDQP